MRSPTTPRPATDPRSPTQPDPQSRQFTISPLQILAMAEACLSAQELSDALEWTEAKQREAGVRHEGQ